MRAMILAAGFGTRLRPYSLLRPKPLFPILGRPLLGLTLDRLRQAGFSEIVVNAHHLGAQIAQFLEGQPGVTVQMEAEVLGTGGGLRMARPSFGSEPLLVTNGDIYHTIDLAMVYAHHRRSGAAVTMVMHDYPRFNRVGVTAGGRVCGFTPEEAGEGAKLLAFTGLHVLDPRVLDSIPVGSFYNILDCYRAGLRHGLEIRALVVPDPGWWDMGTPADYLALHGHLLAAPARGAGGRANPRFLQGLGVRLGRGVELVDWVALGDQVTVGAGAHLERVVVWDGVRIEAGTVWRDTIVVPELGVKG